MSKKFERFTGVNGVRVIQVVEVTSLAGEGTENRPKYDCIEYYSFDGELLARRKAHEVYALGEFHESEDK